MLLRAKVSKGGKVAIPAACKKALKIKKFLQKNSFRKNTSRKHLLKKYICKDLTRYVI